MASPASRRSLSGIPPRIPKEPSSPVKGYLAQLRLLASMNPVNFRLVITCAENLVKDKLQDVAIDFFMRRPSSFWEDHEKDKEHIWELLGLDSSSSS